MSHGHDNPTGVWVVAWQRYVYFDQFDTQNHWFWPAAYHQIATGQAQYIDDRNDPIVVLFVLEAGTVRRHMLSAGIMERVQEYAIAHMN